ncbi:MAG TPA: molybdopterin dinucleotide binding domain-containing protein, partial [Chloroflexota bacterium]|nr:molybdopterin dinucleotide binding domain-containing protein [Chloroflexota bacterium]
PAYASLEGGAIPAEGALVREHGVAAAGEGARAFVSIPETPAAVGAGDGLQLVTYSELLGDEGTLQDVPELLELVPPAYVEVNREDAARLGLREGQPVLLRTPRGSVQREARVNGRCPPGVCYTPDNIGRPRVNALLDWEQPLAVVTLEPAPVPVLGDVPAGAGD